jgi:hypothetical protein
MPFEGKHRDEEDVFRVEFELDAGETIEEILECKVYNRDREDVSTQFIPTAPPPPVPAITADALGVDVWLKRASGNNQEKGRYYLKVYVLTSGNRRLVGMEEVEVNGETVHRLPLLPIIDGF